MTVELFASEFPHSYRSLTTRGFYGRFLTAIALVLAVSVFRYGWFAISQIIAAGTAAWVSDRAVASFARRPNTSADMMLSSMVLVALLPPAVPWYVTAGGVVVMVLVGKWTFGGVGAFWMHPAVLIYIVIVISFPGLFEQWYVSPRAWPGPNFDVNVTEFLNLRLFSIVGANVDAGWISVLLGASPGPLGGATAMVLLAGVILLADDVFPVLLPLFYVVALVSSLQIGGWDDLFGAVFHGQAALTAFFLIPDPVCRPKTYLGLAILPLFCGALTGVLFLAGVQWGAPVLAFAIANTLTPLVDSLAGREYIRGLDA